MKTPHLYEGFVTSPYGNYFTQFLEQQVYYLAHELTLDVLTT
ncbi:hypothetical protein [Nostoc sp.]